MGADVRRAAKIDGNQEEIVACLRRLGISVDPLLARIGQGRPDIAVGYRGGTYLYEIKLPGADLTPDEREWWSKWGGHVRIARGVEDILRDLGLMEVVDGSD